MELPIKNFKISTKKKETPNSKANPTTTTTTTTTTLLLLQSKTPLKNIKAQSKSRTANRNVRKIIAVKVLLSIWFRCQQISKNLKILAIYLKFCVHLY